MIVASRYAKSLLDLALEKGQLDAVYSDMLLVKEVSGSNREFVLFLNSPIVKTDKKIEALKAIFAGKLGELSLSFMTLMTNKHRESYLPQIADAFVSQYKEHKKILTAVITSATGLDAATKAKALELVKAQSKGEVELVEKVDPSVIGGFVLRIGDQQVDRTVLRQLANLKKSFSENKSIS